MTPSQEKYSKHIQDVNDYFENNKAIISKYLSLVKQADQEGERMCQECEKENDYTFTLSLANVKGFTKQDIVKKVFESLSVVSCTMSMAPIKKL
jgi:hypothetical protein